MTDAFRALVLGTNTENKAPTSAAPVTIASTGTDTQYGLRALESEAETVASAPSGQRNDTLNRAAFRMGRLVPDHLDPATVHDALYAAARRAGLPDYEIRTVLRPDKDDSGIARGQRAPRQVAPLEKRDNLPTLTVIQGGEPAPAEHATVEGEQEFWQAREHLGIIEAYARARMVAPWAVFGTVLARIIACVSPEHTIPPIVGGHASLNLFVGLVGRSGAGKGAAESVAAEAVLLPQPVETRTPGSGEGILHAYAKRAKDEVEMIQQSIMFSVPEIDSLGAVGARQGSTLMPLIRSAWSGEQLGFTYADPTKNLKIEAHRYRMTMVAGIQPGRAGTLLDDADGGTPQRFLWLPATDPDAGLDAPEPPDPHRWTFRGSRAWTREEFEMATSTFQSPSPTMHPIDVCDTARTVIRENRAKQVRGEGDALDGHGLLTRLKVAAALGILDGRMSVSDEDWELSGIVSAKSTAVRDGIVAEFNARKALANEARAMDDIRRSEMKQSREAERLERVQGVILRHLENHGESPRWKVRNATASRDRAVFDDALRVLREDGRVSREGPLRLM